MPRFFFDLFLDKYVVLDPGGMVLAGMSGARTAAAELAHHLFVSRHELRDSGSWIRVRDHRGNEMYRLNVGPDSVAEAPR